MKQDEFEKKRIENLNSFHILDTLPEQEFDDITAIASKICETPISLISLIDVDRQWFKSRVGISINETPRSQAFCDHSIKSEEDIFTMQDARKDERFVDNPLVTGIPNIVFYAGAVLQSSDGFPLGTLCVIDNKPRELSKDQIDSLKILSRQISSQLELRKKRIQLEKENAQLNQLKRLFDLSPNLMCIFDKETERIQSMNNTFTETLGWTLSDVHQMSPHDFDHKESAVKFADLISGFKSSEKFERHVVRMKRKDGDYNWIRWTLKPHPHMGEFFAVGENLDELKSQEAEKIKIEDKLRHVFDQAVYGVGVIDISKNRLYFNQVNQGLSNLLGFSKEELTTSTILEISHPEEVEANKELVLTPKYEEEIDTKIKRRFIRKNKGEIWCDTHVKKSANSNDLIVTLDDITRKYYARERQLFLRKELIESQKKLTYKNEELKQFGYIASHDLQEPLRTISSLVEIILEDFKEHITEENINYFNYLSKAVNRMSELISGLLAYSQLDQELEREKFDLNQLVGNVTDDLSTAVNEKQALINFKDLPVIYASKLHIRQLFQNLFTNALKFQPPGNIPVIDIGYFESKEYHKFHVKDNGIGIPNKFQEKIFAIFQRLHGREEHKGVGIGLANCKKIIEIHDGQIWFESDGESGTEFIFTLKK